MRALDVPIRLPDRYRAVRHVANGGMASVWAAEDELLGRLVAVKILARSYATDPVARRRFMREARAAARVSDHPHVVTIYDVGETEPEGEGDPPEAFIVMEHLPGGTVSERLRSGEPVPVPTALRWLEEAASALDAAHAAGIVHRDVKPGNLLLDDRGRLAVGDFGIASITGETGLTQAGQVVGTAAYLSPEQGRGESATPASDRYSLAVVAYELLCGRRPFNGDTPVAEAHAHVHAEPPEPDGVCAAAAEALRHGLAKDPGARPHSAAAFVAELREAVGDHATAVTQPAGAPRTPAPRSGRAFPALVAGALALGAVLAVALALANGPDQASQTSAQTAAAPDQGATAQEAGDEADEGSSPAARSAPEEEAPAAAPSPEQQAEEPAGPSQPDGAADPVAANARGFSMLPGDPQGAIPVLRQSVEGFRSQGRTDEPTYAYALYNLGWALRLSGDAEAALPYLQERMKYPDPSGDAGRELARAQREAGRGGNGRGNGQAKGKAKGNGGGS